MRRIASIVAVFMLFTGSFVMLPAPARAQGGAAKWSVDDFWEYTGQTNLSGSAASVILRLTVDRTADLTVGIHVYQTFNCSLLGTVSVGSLSFDINSYVNFRTSDLARVRVWYEDPIYGGWKESLFDPPLQNFQFPLSNGQTWISNSTLTYSSNSGESTSNVTFDYSVSGPASVTVPAGTFSTFAIAEDENASGHPGIMDYSDAVGFGVRLNGTMMGLSFEGAVELKSFNYQSGSAWNMTIILLDVIIIVVVVALLLALFLRARRKAHVPVPPLQSQHGQTTQQPDHRPPSPPFQP